MSSKSRPGRVEFPVLLLAAGASRRMGRAKALLPLPGGGTLLERALAQARQLSPEVRVVAGARYPIRFRCRRHPPGACRCAGRRRYTGGLVPGVRPPQPLNTPLSQTIPRLNTDRLMARPTV
jgi:hypothetical protein